MKKHLIHLSVPIFFSILFIHLNSCEISDNDDDLDFNYVKVTIEVPFNISANTAIVGGNIMSKRGITAKGMIWSLNINEVGLVPYDEIFNLYYDTRNSDHGSGSGNISSTLNFLRPNSTYYVRAYAFDEYGEFHPSETLSFTTLEKPVVFGDGVIDIDGNEYTTVIINKKEWMAENLYTTHLNDGTPIQLETNQTLWENLTSPGYCWYGNNQAVNGTIYGALYNGHAVLTDRLCPAGWHVPTISEWKSLINYLGGEQMAKAKLTVEYKTISGTLYLNEVGFSALMGGIRSSAEWSRGFKDLSISGFWWSSTINDSDSDSNNYLTLVGIRPDYGHTYKGMIFTDHNTNGYSVRCIKD